MKPVNGDWDGKWPRYDPNRGYSLCDPCWNGLHFNPAYKDAKGVLRPKVSNCKEGGCGCGCIHGTKLPRKPKFTGEGQTSISMENPIEITKGRT